MTITKLDPGSGEATTGRWELAPERSEVGFRVRLRWGIATVTGRFDEFSGRLDPSAAPACTLTVKAASLRTGNRRRDRHLRSSDFFDAETHPDVRFVSDSAVQKGDTLTVTGRLFARGESIPLSLDAQIRHVDGELEIGARTTVEHRDLGMVWSPLGLIGPRSELFVNARLIPRAGAKEPR
jgi:polyisoprenoid-binding protein YceI